MLGVGAVSPSKLSLRVLRICSLTGLKSFCASFISEGSNPLSSPLETLSSCCCLIFLSATSDAFPVPVNALAAPAVIAD